MSMPDMNRAKPPREFERRRRRQDSWRIVLNYLAYLVYPLLLINVLIFVGVASEDQKASAATKIGQAAGFDPAVAPEEAGIGGESPSAAQSVSGWVQVYAFMPIMLAGIVMGVAGIVIDRKRARRRSDSSLMTPLVLTILSVVGLLIYFIART